MTGMIKLRMINRLKLKFVDNILEELEDNRHANVLLKKGNLHRQRIEINQV